MAHCPLLCSGFLKHHVCNWHCNSCLFKVKYIKTANLDLYFHFLSVSAQCFSEKKFWQQLKKKKNFNSIGEHKCLGQPHLHGVSSEALTPLVKTGSFSGYVMMNTTRWNEESEHFAQVAIHCGLTQALWISWSFLIEECDIIQFGSDNASYFLHVLKEVLEGLIACLLVQVTCYKGKWGSLLFFNCRSLLNDNLPCAEQLVFRRLCRCKWN